MHEIRCLGRSWQGQHKVPNLRLLSELRFAPFLQSDNISGKKLLLTALCTKVTQVLQLVGKINRGAEEPNPVEDNAATAEAMLRERGGIVSLTVFSFTREKAYDSPNPLD